MLLLLFIIYLRCISKMYYKINIKVICISKKKKRKNQEDVNVNKL